MKNCNSCFIKLNKYMRCFFVIAKKAVLSVLRLLKNIFVKWQIWCILTIVAFIIGFCCGNKKCFWAITPFNNTANQFDYEIMWTAIGAIGAVIISCVSVWQTKLATAISQMSLENELNHNSCVIDFDDSINEPCVSVKRFIDGSGKGLYIRLKNYGNIDIENYATTVSFLDTSAEKELKIQEGNTYVFKGAYLRRGGTFCITANIPPIYIDMLQMRIDFEFVTRTRKNYIQSLFAQFIICQEDTLAMRETFIKFYM